MLVAGAAAPWLAWSQPAPILETASVCLDPPSISFVARSQADKDKQPGCRTWSTVAMESDPFAGVGGPAPNCAPASRADINRRFLGTLLYGWGIDLPAGPTPADVLKDPSRLTLRPIGATESRAHALIIWPSADPKRTVVGQVRSDSGQTGLGALTVSFPTDVCNGRAEMRADKLATELGATSQPQYLRRVLPKFLWNRWVQDGQGAIPARIVRGEPYWFGIDFSAFDFRAYREDPAGQAKGVKLPDELADQLRLDQSNLKILILPLGKFLTGFPEQHNVNISLDLIKESLRTQVLNTSGSYPAYSDTLGALRRIAPGGTNPVGRGIQYAFTPGAAGCAAIAALVIDESKRKVVQWLYKSFRVHPSPKDPPAAESPAGEPDCNESDEVAQRLDLGALARFDALSGVTPTAVFSIVDVDNYTLAAFIDKRPGRNAEYVWPLARAELKSRMSTIAKDVDAQIERNDYRFEAGAFNLGRWLFTCDADFEESCEQMQRAVGALRELMSSAPPDVPVIEASFRDSRGATYFLPFEMLAVDGTYIGTRIRVHQPLHVPVPARPHEPAGCSQSWYAGLVVKDQLEDLSAKWREDWLGGSMRVKGFQQVKAFRTEYLETKPQDAVPEALVVLAHHGESGLGTHADSVPEREVVEPEDIKRRFPLSSFAVLAVCSGGALGFAQRANSEIINRLNDHQIGAVIMSPFKLPVPLAKAFLDTFRDKLIALRAPKSLFELMKETRAGFAGKSEYLRSVVQSLQIVGNGDIRVCPQGSN